LKPKGRTRTKTKQKEHFLTSGAEQLISMEDLENGVGLFRLTRMTLRSCYMMPIIINKIYAASLVSGGENCVFNINNRRENI